MRLAPVAALLAAAFILAPVANGYGQDFSITNPVEPANAGRRDVMRQLQAWWDLHAYYPRHASNNDEGGDVKLHLLVHPDGNIWRVEVAQSSGSAALDKAALATFRGGFVRPFPEGAPEIDIDLSLHYVLAHRHDQPVAADYTPVAAAKRPFTIANDPVKSPILETMLQKTCDGSVVKQGIRNHPAYGLHFAAQAVFFRRPDGTPWVKFYEGGYSILAPVTEVGRLVQWMGREEFLKGQSQFWHYTVWSDGGNTLIGSMELSYPPVFGGEGVNTSGTVDFTCATETVPAIAWNPWFVSRIKTPPGDPP